MSWTRKSPGYDWRDFLANDEAKVIAKSDAALAKIDALKEEYAARFAPRRYQIVNRAIQRAKAARRLTTKDGVRR